MQFDDFDFGTPIDEQMFSAEDLMQLQMDVDDLFGDFLLGNKPTCTACSFTCSSTL